MTSIGPNSQSYNFIHSFDIPDLKRNVTKEPSYTQGTLMWMINSDPNFSKIKYMIKLAKLDGIYNDPQANITLFIPYDLFLKHIAEEYFTEMDIGAARQTIQNCTLKYKITSELIEDSAMSYYTTVARDKIEIMNINGITYCRKGEAPYNPTLRIIKKDIIASNGIIQVINGLL